MRNFLLMFLLALSPAQAAQPIHESLVECSAMIDLLIGDQTPPKGQHEMLDLYVHASQVMREEAVRRSDTSYVDVTIVQKRSLWKTRWEEGQWDNPENQADLADWITYCFKLAEHLGLPDPK